MIIHLKVIQMTKKFIIWEGFYALPFCMLDLKKCLCYTEFATQFNIFQDEPTLVKMYGFDCHIRLGINCVAAEIGACIFRAWLRLRIFLFMEEIK